MSNTSTARDTVLNLLKTNYAVTASQTIIAQWNHNRYNTPSIYGYFQDNNPSVSISNIASSYDKGTNTVIPVTLTSNSPVSITTRTVSRNPCNIVRVMFDAKITSISGNISENISEFMIKIVPKNGATEYTEYIDYVNITLVENIYQKQEILFSSNYYDIDNLFDRLELLIMPVNDISPASVVVSLKDISVCSVTRSEVEEDQFSRLSHVFKPNKPGDQILENQLITASINPLTKYYIVSNSFDDSITTPDLLPTLISPFNEINYFLSPPSLQKTVGWDTASSSIINNDHVVFVEYPNTLSTNQLYIKTQNFSTGNFNQFIISKLDRVQVYINDGSGWSASGLIYTTSTGSFISNGGIVLQYNGSTWTEGLNNFSLPSINPVTGSIANVVNVKAIAVVFYNQGQFSRIRLIEISPRLSIDVSNFLISTAFEQMIDDGSQRVPVGLSNVGSGEVVLENLPRWTNPSSESGSLYQIFDNNTLSSLDGLIKPDVKITGYTTVTDTKTSASSGTIKNFTMYANEWKSNDIETISITLNDYAQNLQSMPAPDLLLTNNHIPKKSGNVQKSLEAMFQLGGFSDYDITSLSTVSNLLKKKVQGTIPIYYTSREKKIWDSMSEILIGYQVSAFFDENGILQFRDIIRESSSYSSYSTGSSYYITSSAINNFLPNIISFDKEKKPDVGEITINYKQLSITNSMFDANGNIFDVDKMKIEKPAFKRESNSSTSPWTSPNNTALICANIISNVSRGATRIATGDYNHYDKKESRFITSFNGYGIIEGEIISWDGISYSFSPVAGYSNNEIIRSQDELSDAVAQRMNVLGTPIGITSFKASSTRPVISASLNKSSYTLKQGDPVQVQLIAYDGSASNFIVNTTARVLAVSGSIINLYLAAGGYGTLVGKKLINPSTSASLRVSQNWISASPEFSFVASNKDTISYNMTGSLCNVRRGLFGTNASDHLSQNVYDSTAFIGISTASGSPTGMNAGRTLEKKIEADNATSFILPLPGQKVAYLGFRNRDKTSFNTYRYVFTPTNDIDSFGIFFGAVMAGSPNSMSFTAKTGYFIEFFPPSQKERQWGAEVRLGSNAANTPIYVSKQKLINDKWIKNHYITVKLKDKNGKPIVGLDGKTKTRKKLIKTPPKQNVILVKFAGQKIDSISVNGKVIKFQQLKTKNVSGTSVQSLNSKPSKEINLLINKSNTTFGIFSRNKEATPTSIKIQEIQAHAENQMLDRTGNWEQNTFVESLLQENTGRTSVSKKGRTGFKHSDRPFSLRATPFIRGIEINDSKWEGELPFYDLTVQAISGINGSQLVPDSSVSTSIILGTPFRGRWAHKNNMNEVVYTSANSETYMDGKVFGKSIEITGERKLVRSINDEPGNEKVELSLAWSKGEATAQEIIDDITKNINKMNTLYNVEIFGNPALQVGDYVTLNYPEARLIETKVIIVSVKNNFSDGGISTSLVLRDVHQ